MKALQIGQPVTVCDMSKEPPKHHTRKHSAWKTRNYDGFVSQVHDDHVVVGRQVKSRVAIAQPLSIVKPRAL